MEKNSRIKLAQARAVQGWVTSEEEGRRGGEELSLLILGQCKDGRLPMKRDTAEEKNSRIKLSQSWAVTLGGEKRSRVKGG